MNNAQLLSDTYILFLYGAARVFATTVVVHFSSINIILHCDFEFDLTVFVLNSTCIIIYFYSVFVLNLDD